MSFVCDNCKSPVAPRIKPTTLIVSQRDTTYTNEVLKVVKKTVGHEIVQEIKVCPPCAGLPTSTPPLPMQGRALEDAMPPLFRQPMSEFVLDNMLVRADDSSHHRSKRSTRDHAAAFTTLKAYEVRKPKH